VVVGVHTSLFQDLHVALKLLNLLQIEDESLRNLFNKKGLVSNVFLNLLFGHLVILLEHLLLKFEIVKRFLALLLEGVDVADDGWRFKHTLTQAVLLVLAVDGLLLLLEFLLAALIELLSAHFHLSFVLFGGLRGFDFAVSALEVSVEAGFLGFHSRVNVLVSRIHVYSQLGTRLSLVEVVWNGYGDLLTLLRLFHRSHESFLESAEVRDWSRSFRLEIEGHLN